MPPRRAPTPEPIGVGDIVLFEHHSWDVVAATVTDATTSPPTVQLRLTRKEQTKVPTPYGKPQRYTTKPISRLADARRCRLVARQESLF